MGGEGLASPGSYLLQGVGLASAGHSYCEDGYRLRWSRGGQRARASLIAAPNGEYARNSSLVGRGLGDAKNSLVRALSAERGRRLSPAGRVRIAERKRAGARDKYRRSQVEGPNRAGYTKRRALYTDARDREHAGSPGMERTS